MSFLLLPLDESRKHYQLLIVFAKYCFTWRN